MATVNFKQLFQLLPHVLNARHPVLIRGDHGIGKSMAVGHVAKEMGLRLVSRRASQMTEGDFCGLPSIVDEVTKFSPPDWYFTACTVPCLLFLDEVDRGVLEVRQGIFELLDSRTVFGRTLHPDTVIVAAINGGGARGAQYAVNSMDPAELDRYTVFDLVPDVQDWLDWAATKSDADVPTVEPLIREFIAADWQHLEHKTTFEPNKVYPSRRSWHRYSDCARVAKLFDFFGKEVTDGEKAEAGGNIYSLASAYVGEEAALAFRSFVVETYNKRVSFENILAGTWADKTKGFNASQHNALIDKMNSFDFEKHGILSEKEIDELGHYYVGLPLELAAHCWQTLVANNQKGDLTNNFALLNQLVIDKKEVGLFTVSLFENEAKKDEDK